MVAEIQASSLDSADGTELLAAFGADIVERYPTWTPAAGPSADPAEFVPPNGLFAIAYQDGLAVACGGFKRIAPEVAEIKRLYVRLDQRRAGLARRILDHLEATARGAGYTAVRLDTGNQQPEALTLFESAGYRRIADYNANPFAAYWLEKEL